MSYKLINWLIASGLDAESHGKAHYEFHVALVFGCANSSTIPFGAVEAAVYNDDAKPYHTKSLSSFQIF